MTTSSGSNIFSTAARSPGTKLFALGLLALLILVPLMFVEALQRERSSRLADIGREIAQSWAGEQILAGPFLALPYIVDGPANSPPQRRIAIFLPRDYRLTGVARAEVLRRSIFDVTVYRGKFDIVLSFDPPELASVDSQAPRPLWNEAALVMQVSDVRGIKNRVTLNIGGGGAQNFRPGTTGIFQNNAGIHAPVREADIGREFTLSVDLNGMRSIGFVPIGAHNEITLNANWPHPSFGGAFLPDERTIGEGFTAAWRVGQLARTLPQAFTRDARPLEPLFAANVATVRFYQPVDIYQLVSRAIKYGILLVGAVYLVVFGLEMLARENLHVAQYALVGVALIVFYVLLLSYTEHIGFSRAYLLSAGATTALIAIYIGLTLRSWAKGAILGASLALAYGLVYLLMRSEDYALVAGATAAFVGVALIMMLTLRLDWWGALGAATSRFLDRADRARPVPGETTP